MKHESVQPTCIKLKGLSQPGHMRSRFLSISYLHITEMRLAKYDKNDIVGYAKANSNTGFPGNDRKSSSTIYA